MRLLVDTNIFLEVLLAQERAEAAQQFLSKTEEHEFFIAEEHEVIAAIREGDREPARGNRVMYRKNFAFDKVWRKHRYGIKQVVPVLVWKNTTDWLL